MRGMKRIGLKGLLLAALLLAAAGQALAQSGKVLVVPFAVNAADALHSVQGSLPPILAEKLKALGVTAQAEGGKAAPDAAAARKLAGAARAEYVVFGSISKVGEGLSLDARVAKVGGGEPQAVFASAATVMGLDAAAAQLADKIKPLVAVSTAAGGGSDRIVEVDVEGNSILDKEVVILKVKSQVNQAYDPKTVNDDVKKLFDMGYFDDVQVRLDNVAGGKRLTFVVKEKPRIQAIGVTGNGDVKKDDILEAMSTKAGGVLNLKVLADDLGKIRELYSKKGYYKTEVTYELEQTDPRIARLNIVIKEPKKLYIKEVKIEGAKQISAGDLQDELATSTRHFWSWVTGSGVLKEEMLERDAAALESYYANRGFVDARVGQPEVIYGDDGITVIFRVEEGDRYKVGSVAFSGDLLFDQPKLMDRVKLDELSGKGEYFNRSVVRDDLNALAELYADDGYAFAEADVDMQKHADTKTIDITYMIAKGRKVYVRRVTIEGNDKTRDNVIRREVKLADGDMFSGSKLRRSNERLDKLEYFEKIDIETVPTDNPGEVDIKVKVKDKNTGSISLGAGYSTSDSVFFGGSVEEKNLFGKGYHAKFQGMFSGKSSRGILSFTNPYVYDTNLSVGADIYQVYRAYDDFKKSTSGAKLRFAYPLGEYTILSWDYRLDHYHIYHTNPWASSVITESAGWHWSSSVFASIDRDTVDSATKPTKGTKNTLSLEYAGGVVGGDDAFVKPMFTSNFFYPLPLDLVFHWRGQAGVLLPNAGGDIPVYERFYLGGINNVRGYELDKISPKDPWTGERIGGKAEFFTNFETIFPISKSNGLFGVAFFDAGNSWREYDQVCWDFYRAVGAGVRWYSPLGLIRVEYGYGLDADKHNLQPSQIGFSMGQTF
ncbi:outer membrane protein assembly factor BamA [Solidesulfovibrio carbinolicus]|uniref:Outer membrane protein assembly factor BamA n=1 Tax=Solidesulfovibrio carbinolicus TaxID=296842 RepID=A0A4P6HHS7_9BACT|nr:outer membrane protein assembly factor BamA [Solidesulfovibrio carbinolicus]QAZ66335.1 outer membrane protein assembly factor BamA [Solidesulfovibrio carbinolicus]